AMIDEPGMSVSRAVARALLHWADCASPARGRGGRGRWAEREGAPMPFAGELAGLACALSWSVTTLAVRQEGKRAGVFAINAIAAPAAAACLLLLLAVRVTVGGQPIVLGAQPWLGLSYLVASVLFTSGLGDNLFFLGLQRIGVARAMPIAMSQPLLTVVLAVALLGER